MIKISKKDDGVKLNFNNMDVVGGKVVKIWDLENEE
jgi:hypothetical protein